MSRSRHSGRVNWPFVIPSFVIDWPLGHWSSDIHNDTKGHHAPTQSCKAPLIASFDQNSANFAIASSRRDISFPCSVGKLNQEENVNSELCKQALAKVGNPNVLINLVSRRVRQLNSGGGNLSRPLLNDTTGLGAADIALTEIIEDKMGWEAAEELVAEVSPKRRNKRG